MRLAMKMPPKKGPVDSDSPRDDDPRESESAEIIDLASRSAFPAVARKKGGGDTMGMVAGIAIVAAHGSIPIRPGKPGRRSRHRRPMPRR